jgi:predicted HAD superfamily hydrolase
LKIQFFKRYHIDLNGNVRLLKKLDFSKYWGLSHNVTLLVKDEGGLTDYSNLIIYFNITSSIETDDSALFDCALFGVKAELDQRDRRTLKPNMFIMASSLYKLEYRLIQTTEPYLSSLAVNENSGQVYFKTPLSTQNNIEKYDSFILSFFQLNFD